MALFLLSLAKSLLACLGLPIPAVLDAVLAAWLGPLSVAAVAASPPPELRFQSAHDPYANLSSETCLTARFDDVNQVSAPMSHRGLSSEAPRL